MDKSLYSESDLIGLARKVLERGFKTGKPALILLEGEMGAGKSTFARAILNELGVREEQKGSPTYAIVHQYEGEWARKKIKISHADLYRVREESELEERGVIESFYSSDVVISEWTKNFPDFYEACLNDSRFLVCEILLKLSSDDEKLRQIIVF